MTLPSSVEGSSLESNDAALAARIRTGDEAAFAALVDRYHNAMLRVARSLVRDREVAAEVVQETWLGAVRGIDRFEGRSSLKTWLFSILLNIARTRARREQRSIAFSSVGAGDEGDDEPAVAADRFSAEGACDLRPGRLGGDAGGTPALHRNAHSRRGRHQRTARHFNARSSPCATSKAGARTKSVTL